MSRTVCLLFWLLLVPAAAQDPQSPSPGAAEARALEAALRARLGQAMPELDLDLAFFGEDFFGATPTELEFEPDGRSLLFSWKRWDEAERGLWRADFERRTLERLPEDFEKPRLRVWSRDRRKSASVLGASIRLEISGLVRSFELARLGGEILGLAFSADEEALLVTTASGLFRVSAKDAGFVQLLEFASGSRRDAATLRPQPQAPTAPGDTARDHLAREEAELLRVVAEAREQERREEERSARRARERPLVLRYQPPADWRRESCTPDPAGRFAALSLARTGAEARAAEVPDFVTTSGYVEVRKTRPKVGDGRTLRALEIVDLETGAVVTAALVDPSDPGTALRHPRWSPDGLELFASAVRDDDRESWLCRVDPGTGAASVVHRLADPAWVLFPSFALQWLGTGGDLVFRSEEGGWQHVWRLDRGAPQARQLTRGEFEITAVEAAPDGRILYAVGTPGSPHRRDLLRIDAATGETSVLEAPGGGRSIALGPDGVLLAEVFSSADRPWELALRELGSTEPPWVVTDSPSPAFRSHRGFRSPEIVQIPASDGALVPARIYRPDPPVPPRAAVLFVHGAGYLQNVHEWWSRYEREYAFHHALAAKGCIVLDLDYRGSSGYGRDWRCAIHGHMGGRDLEDYVDAARWLATWEGVDPGRIGIYGGSYGGFLTLMALFTRPGTFRAGAALRPVTDWAHYSDGYTSNILDTPVSNREAFRASSPIWHAAGLRDHLLICHGLRDGNVHAQDSIRLLQRLIELRKSHFEVAFYPAEDHAFRDAASWSDEYRRVGGLFDRVLLAP
jgi:acetyl esterase/lipase